MVSKKIEAFVNEIKLINWFEKSGNLNEKYYMVFLLC